MLQPPPYSNTGYFKSWCFFKHFFSFIFLFNFEWIALMYLCTVAQQSLVRCRKFGCRPARLEHRYSGRVRSAHQTIDQLDVS